MSDTPWTDARRTQAGLYDASMYVVDAYEVMQLEREFVQARADGTEAWGQVALLSKQIDELLTAPRAEVGAPNTDALVLVHLLAETAPIQRWKEYEDRGEERIPCFISVETAKEIAELSSSMNKQP